MEVGPGDQRWCWGVAVLGPRAGWKSRQTQRGEGGGEEGQERTFPSDA